MALTPCGWRHSTPTLKAFVLSRSPFWEVALSLANRDMVPSDRPQLSFISLKHD